MAVTVAYEGYGTRHVPVPEQVTRDARTGQVDLVTRLSDFNVPRSADFGVDEKKGLIVTFHYVQDEVPDPVRYTLRPGVDVELGRATKKVLRVHVTDPRGFLQSADPLPSHDAERTAETHKFESRAHKIHVRSMELCGNIVATLPDDVRSEILRRCGY